MRSLVVCLLALIVGALLAPVSPAQASHTATRFSDGLPAGARPWQIAPGPDGNLWFTDRTDPGSIGRISTSGAISVFTAGLTTRIPKDIAAGPDGNLWFTSQKGVVGRITPTGTITEYLPAGLSVNDNIAGIAAGADGNLWFTVQTYPGAIGRITPAGVSTLFTVGLTPNQQPLDIAAGPDGNVWFTTKGGRLGRITPAGLITEFTAGLPAGADIQGIAAGPDGNLWFTINDVPGAVGRVTPSGAITLFTAGLSEGRQPAHIVAGPDGAMWFTLSPSVPGAVGRITIDGEITEFTDGFLAGDAPTGIAVGPDGKIWFTLGQVGGAVVRIDSALTSPAPPAPAPAALAPEINAVSVASVGETSVTLSATVDAGTAETGFSVDYGPASELGSQTATRTIAAGTTEDVRTTIAGLAPGQTYRFRMVATNAVGTARTGAATFTTAGTRVPGAPPFAPVKGVSVVVERKAGLVRVRARGTDRFRNFTSSAAQLPVGSVVDARRGRLRLSSGREGGSRVQSATLWGGAFKVRQSRRGRGVTEFVLFGGHRSVCGRPTRAAGANGYAENARRRARARKGRRTAQRRLWASDRRGLFRTRGRNSVATVRGTKWVTVDRCDGTLTKVITGAVVVRDVRRKRNVLVRAGKSYLALKAPPRRRR